MKPLCPAIPTQPSAAPPARPQPTPHRWLSQALLADANEAHIIHGDQVYRLRLTAQGKLILTK